jgi:type II secretory pathway pseudopilin PulG
MADDLERGEEQIDKPKKQEPITSHEPETDDDLEIELGPAIAQPRSGGCRPTTVVLLIIVLAIAATAILYMRHVQQAREAELKARMEREEQYKSWLGHVSADVTEAIALAQAGQMTDAQALLERAEQKLTLIGTQANDANDQQWASYAITRKQALLTAKRTIAEEYERYIRAIDDALAELGSKFGGLDPGAGAPATPAGEAEEEAVAPSEQAPATDPGHVSTPSADNAEEPTDVSASPSESDQMSPEP